MAKYLRFGEIPKNEKSINFKKITFSQSEDFTWALKNVGYDGALKDIPEKALENGVSVFVMGADGLPVLHTMKEAVSLSCRIGDGLKIYQVSGEEVGAGNDGEPLIKNVKIEKQRRISVEKLAQCVIAFLAAHFSVAIPPAEPLECSEKTYRISNFSQRYQINPKTGEKKPLFWSDPDDGFVKMPEYTLYCFCGWKFYFPVPGFDCDML